MNDNRTQHLQEQYEDALFALLMEEQAQENGEKLLEEFQAAQDNGLVPDMPQKLDEKCRNTIRRHFAKKKAAAQIQHFLRTTGKRVALFVAVMYISSALLLSVDAIREPVFNFFIDVHNRYITFNPNPTEAKELLADGSILSGLVPNDYYVRQFVEKSNGHFYIDYKNDNGASITFQSHRAEALISFDTEDAVVRKARIAGYEGLLIEKAGYLITWEVPEIQTLYIFTASHLSLDEVWFIAETLAERCREGTLITGD